MAAGPMLALADDLSARARRAGATLIVNDRADVAALSRAHGVHVGQDDLSPALARQVVGVEAIVGLSTHTEAHVEAALAEPISYLAIGPVFATTSKAQPDPVVGLGGVARAAARAGPSGVPVVAIGGITLDRASDVLAAGASSVAVISDLLVGDVHHRARQFIERLRD
jgi:thiamine-phosphate pyrophosphorylase